MGTLRRRLAGTLAASLALLVVAIPPAQAADEWVSLAQWTQDLAERDAALRVPGGTIAGSLQRAPGQTSDRLAVRRIAGAQSNAAAGARGLTLVPSDAITSASDPIRKVGAKAAGAAGTMLTSAVAVDLSYSLATGAMSWAGLSLVDDSSGDLVCDFQALFRQCEIGPAAGYVVNQDVSVSPAGWDGDPVVEATSKDQAGAPVKVTAAFDFAGVSAGPITGRAWIDGNLGQQSYYPRPTVSFVTVQRRPDGTLAEYPVSSPVIYIGSPQPWSSPLPVFAGNQVVSVRARLTYAGYQGITATVVESPKWYPEDDPNRPAGAVPDPERQWVTTYRCSDGTEGTASSGPWRESDATWPEPPAPGCASPVYVRVDQTSPGLDTWTMYEWEQPAAAAAFADTYPQCADAACVLELHRLDVVSGTRLSCFDNPAACAAWFEDPARDTAYACTYAGQDVPLSDCYVYAPTFDYARSTATGPGYADPETGQVPATTAPGGTAPPAGECPPPFEFTLGGIGYWVTKGVTCAMQAVFVPTRSDASLGRIRQAVNATAPVVWSSSVAGMFDAVPAAAGCEGPLLHFEAFGMTVDARPFSACEAPMSTAAMWTRNITTVLVVVFGSMACVRALGSGFGWKPSAGGDS